MPPRPRALAELTEAHCDADLNARSVLTASRKAMPWLKRQGGFIVNTSSIAARNGAGGGAGLMARLVSNVTPGMAKELIGSRQRGGAGHHRDSFP